MERTLCAGNAHIEESPFFVILFEPDRHSQTVKKGLIFREVMMMMPFICSCRNKK
jgi:hypothetical protein